jgi:hypothetical protein
MGQRDRCTSAIVKAAPIIIFRFLDAVRQVVGIGGVTAVSKSAVVYVSRVAGAALFTAFCLGRVGRQCHQRHKGVAKENRTPQRRCRSTYVPCVGAPIR